jgi:hypothetical protein
MFGTDSVLNLAGDAQEEEASWDEDEFLIL